MTKTIDLKAPEAFFNRELSWLNFARRVVAQVSDLSVPLMERVKFAGIVGMLHDEFFMKRVSGLKSQIAKGKKSLSLDGKTPAEELAACRTEILEQTRLLEEALSDSLMPALVEQGLSVLDYGTLNRDQRIYLRRYFEDSVEPILTPLAVDAEHPFPFISHAGLNLAVLLPDQDTPFDRFLRIKVPNNRPRWIELPDGAGFVPLEQVITENLDQLIPGVEPRGIYLFRVTRAAGDGPQNVEEPQDDDDALLEPGSLVRQVSKELKARKFAGAVRLQVDDAMPKKLVKWLTSQLKITKDDVYRPKHPIALKDFGELRRQTRGDLYYPPHKPATHPRLRRIDRDPGAIFEQIAKGDLLLHHPYQRFDDSVMRFLKSAAADPQVLAIKVTIYRTGKDSQIVQTLAEAARRGKQVAVLVEITASFDEAPNIAWGEYLENEGCHVAYGVERLKTHVKLALVVREEEGGIRRYAHLGTGNYNSTTSRFYEDLGLLTCDRDICDDVAMIFNALTGAAQLPEARKLWIAPKWMRSLFTGAIRREAEHAAAGRRSGIWAKMNQLQDPEIIRELYAAGRAGVPITLVIRGLCCLRPGVAGLSENIRVYSVVGRFLEHSRLYRFDNDGKGEFYLGSADWMKRNLDRRVETVFPVEDPALVATLDSLTELYDSDNCSAWDCGADGRYRCRQPRDGEDRRNVQESLVRMAGLGTRSDSLTDLVRVPTKSARTGDPK